MAVVPAIGYFPARQHRSTASETMSQLLLIAFAIDFFLLIIDCGC
jgi:hypothetical protein